MYIGYLADFPAELLAPFKESGVDTEGIINCGKSTCSQLMYDSAGNKEIKFPSRADTIKASDVPDAYKNCQMMYICTMEDDVPAEELADVVSFGLESAVDLGGYGGVHMGKNRRSQIGDVVEYALKAASNFDFVKASDEDCHTIFSAKDAPEIYAKKLLTGKARAVLITMGSKGVYLEIKDQGGFHVPALEGRPIDATGGGDTFMAGFLSEYLRCKDILKAAIFGSATALCVIEKTGGVKPERMPSEEQARSRIPQDIMEKITKN